jgi:preprotein translocase subunit SecF
MQFKTFDIVPHGTKFDFVGKRHIAVVLSLIVNLAVIAWCIPQIHGLNFGVDFAGGTEMEVKFTQSVDPAELRKTVEDLGLKDASVQTYGPESDHAYLIRVGRIVLMSDADVQRVVNAVQEKFQLERWSFNPELGDTINFEFKAPPPEAELRAVVEGAGIPVREVNKQQGLTSATQSLVVRTQGIGEKVAAGLSQKFASVSPIENGHARPVQRTEYVGPAVGRELRVQGLKAILLAMALIVVYVGFRFDFRFAPGVVIALVHDAVVTLGYFAFSGREFNLTSIAVILTVVGYSVNDTVVIYDRIRENMGKLRGKSLGEIVNLSINEVLGRTFLTSFATALSLVGLLVYGVGTIFDFSMGMLVGIISGTYSTWFIAAPMTIWLEDRAEKKQKAGQHPGAARQPAEARTASK